MRLLEAQLSFTRPCRRVFETACHDGADPQGSHELETRRPVQVLRVPFPEGNDPIVFEVISRALQFVVGKR